MTFFLPPLTIALISLSSLYSRLVVGVVFFFSSEQSLMIIREKEL